MTTKRNPKVQISLNPDNLRERNILNYLQAYGTRTGLPKQQFIVGMELFMAKNPIQGFQELSTQLISKQKEIDTTVNAIANDATDIAEPIPSASGLEGLLGRSSK